MDNKWIVDCEESGERLSTFIRKKLGLPTSLIEWSIEHQGCAVNGNIERFCSYKLKKGDRIAFQPIDKPNFVFNKKAVLYEDEHLLAYDKPAYIATTGPKSLETIVKLKAAHRLDRDTTGVVLFAKQKQSLEHLEGLFRKRLIKKSYLALVHGVPKKEHGSIENYLGKVAQREGAVTWGIVNKTKGVLAKTDWEVVERGKKMTLLRVFPHTGRTHQIRIHLQSIGHPIVGDVQYGQKNKMLSQRPLLHAHTLSFDGIDIVSPVPHDLSHFVASTMRCGG